MARKWDHCWCGKKLVDVTVHGVPIGVYNCDKHTCWYENKKEYFDAQKRKMERLSKR